MLTRTLVTIGPGPAYQVKDLWNEDQDKDNDFAIMNKDQDLSLKDRTRVVVLDPSAEYFCKIRLVFKNAAHFSASHIFRLNFG